MNFELFPFGGPTSNGQPGIPYFNLDADPTGQYDYLFKYLCNGKEIALYTLKKVDSQTINVNHGPHFGSELVYVLQKIDEGYDLYPAFYHGAILRLTKKPNGDFQAMSLNDNPLYSGGVFYLKASNRFLKDIPPFPQNPNSIHTAKIFAIKSPVDDTVVCYANDDKNRKHISFYFDESVRDLASISNTEDYRLDLIHTLFLGSDYLYSIDTEDKKRYQITLFRSQSPSMVFIKKGSNGGDVFLMKNGRKSPQPLLVARPLK
jgi:hypothetical protein